MIDRSLIAIQETIDQSYGMIAILIDQPSLLSNNNMFLHIVQRL